MRAGDRFTVRIEKPAAGGRMIARHEGAVMLVSGAIPGELVTAQVEKVQRGTTWARTVGVEEPSDDRVDAGSDWACGGNVFAHIAYPRQLALKAAIIEDAFTRIGRTALPSPIDVAASPTTGYRMRARLHVVNNRVGFFREGTHDLCDAAVTRQLLPESCDVLRALEALLARHVPSRVKEIELSENCAADERALHLVLHDETSPSRLEGLPAVEGVRGISCGGIFGERPHVLWGHAEISDELAVPAAGGDRTMVLTRQAHSFFQGNRFLLSSLVREVVQHVPHGSVIDLYAGVGLFSVALAVSGDHDVVAIEGDRVSAHDLKRNAARAGTRIEALQQSVEAYLRSAARKRPAAVFVDPPRTGMTKDALLGVLALEPARLVYVSCDVATLARDSRAIVDRGYRLIGVRAFDLFPNTAHVESVAVFDN